MAEVSGGGEPMAVAGRSGGAPRPAGVGGLRLDDWGRLDRYLCLGVAGGVYGAGHSTPAHEVEALVERCLTADGPQVVDRVVAAASVRPGCGASAFNLSAVRVLALAAARGDAATKALALANLGRVCASAAALFAFVDQIQSLRGWGRGVRRAVASWYRGRYSEELAYQVLACRRRCGWSHRDILRLAHPRPVTREQGAVFRWILRGDTEGGERTVVRRLVRQDELSSGDGGLDEGSVYPERYCARVYPGVGELPPLLRAFERARRAGSEREMVNVITEESLPAEVVPARWLRNPEVWEALLDRMPVRDLLRQLGRLSAVGLLAPGAEAVRRVEARLRDKAALRLDGVHPLEVLVAQRQYAAGGVEGGAVRWTPVPAVVEAAEAAFYASFGNAPSVGRPVLYALDASRSMARNRVLGSTLSAQEAAVAMALVAATVDPGSVVVTFTSGWTGPLGRLRVGGQTGLTILDVSPGLRLEAVLERLQRLPTAGADPALPLSWAKRHRLDVCGAVVFTDDETWVKTTHPAESLRAYRSERVPDARLAVVGMTSPGFALADPDDAGMLDVVGMDVRVPGLVTRFLRGGGENRALGAG